MKTLIGLGLISGLIGFGVGQLWPNNDKGYYVILKVPSTGNTISLSEKFSTYDQCIVSADYQLHSLVSKESNAIIQCSNTRPKYKL